MQHGRREKIEFQQRNAPSRLKRLFEKRSAKETSQRGNINEREFSSFGKHGQPDVSKKDISAETVVGGGGIYPGASTLHSDFPPSVLPVQPSAPMPPMVPRVTHNAQVVEPVQHHEAQNRAIPQTNIQVYGRNQLSVVCPVCKNSVMTNVTYSCGLATWLVGAAIFMCGGIFGCCLIPCCIESLKDCIHRCPRCGHEIGKIQRLSMGSRRKSYIA